MRVTVKLPGGTIRGTPRSRARREPDIRIVGGTGDFAGARGIGEVRDADGRAQGVLNIYRLQLP